MGLDDFYIILTGILVASSCAILGCFLVLRKLAMLGDAISHAVLPGIVVAYLLSGSRDSLIMVFSAGLTGMLCAFLIEFLHKKANLQSEAGIGVTFTWMFALGVILISMFAGKVDLDQDCVLYGEIAYVPLDLLITEGGLNLGPRPVWILGTVLFLNLALVISGYKELKITGFDPSFATLSGISVSFWHYLLTGAVSFTTVAAFESVGAILVVAFLTVPAASAWLITKSLNAMLIWSVVFAVASVLLGFAASVWFSGSIAGAMATASGLIFFLVFAATRVKRRVVEVKAVI